MTPQPKHDWFLMVLKDTLGVICAANQQEHEPPPKRMANRCPLCTQRWPTQTAIHAHLVCDHRRTGPAATELIEKLCSDECPF